ncbi:transposase-like protein [Kroppenstedtia sanguinis]|uniref:Transposase n=1 Tax=Kroppenstedtia sanguinis TaxID=1380684 RepID=A0ABW4CC96_9BACL
MKRRQWSSEEKVAIVLEGLQQNRSISEVCREHQISQALYYQWRDAFLEGAKAGLRPKRRGKKRLRNMNGS